MIIYLFAESIGKPCKPSVTHSNCQVLTFYIIGANMFWVRITGNSVFLTACIFDREKEIVDKLPGMP